MATMRTQLQYHDGGNLIEAAYSGSGLAWVQINSGHTIDAPNVAVFFDRGLSGVTQIRRLIAELEEAQLAILAKVEEKV
jgi:hypothetical protein